MDPQQQYPEGCEVCQKDVDSCECPECPKCTVQGDPKCYQDHGLKHPKGSILSAVDLAKEMGCHRDGDDEKTSKARIEKSLFKYTRCGVTFGIEGNTVLIGGYCEGSDRELELHRIDFPFNYKDFSAIVDEADQEGVDTWNETHGCEFCGEQDEYGDVEINKDCQACEGHGVII